MNVLGTKFNVKAYSDEELVTTTLTSGKVEIKSEKQSHILKPNEQLNFDKKTFAMNVTEIPSTETDAWISGQLIFTEVSFGEILQVLKRRFNTSFNISKINISTDKRYTVKFNQKENLDEILIVLKDVIGFSYQRNSNEIIIYDIDYKYKK